MLLDEGVTPAQEAGARAAIDLWNRGASTRLTVSQVSRADGAAALPVSPTMPLHFQRAAAPSHGYFDEGTGQILINDDLTSRSLAVTIAHEIGHAFGLVHASGRPSVMTPGNLDVEPTDGDFAVLADIWGPCVPVVDEPPR